MQSENLTVREVREAMQASGIDRIRQIVIDPEMKEPGWKLDGESLVVSVHLFREAHQVGKVFADEIPGWTGVRYATVPGPGLERIVREMAQAFACSTVRVPMGLGVAMFIEPASDDGHASVTAYVVDDSAMSSLRETAYRALPIRDMIIPDFRNKSRGGLGGWLWRVIVGLVADEGGQ